KLKKKPKVSEKIDNEKPTLSVFQLYNLAQEKKLGSSGKTFSFNAKGQGYIHMRFKNLLLSRAEKRTIIEIENWFVLSNLTPCFNVDSIPLRLDM
ncbi:hypothetical protein WDU94_012194, partial [Cyamophila willieti]